MDVVDRIYDDIFSIYSRIRTVNKSVSIRVHPQDDYGKRFFEDRRVKIDVDGLEKSYEKSTVIIGMYTSCFIDARSSSNITVCYMPGYLTEEIRYKMLNYSDIIFSCPSQIDNILCKDRNLIIYRSTDCRIESLQDYI